MLGGRTKKRIAKLLVVLICCMLFVFLVIDASINFPWESPAPPGPLTWMVSEGEEFIFNVSASGFYEFMWEPVRVPEPLSFVVNTCIRVRIESLPNSTINSEQNLINMVNTGKVSCIFANGTEIPSETKIELQQLVSRCFFPVEGWDYIDWLFPDNPRDVAPSNWIFETYLSRCYNDTCYFGFYKCYVDYGNSWGANISLTTGIPRTMTTGAFESAGVGFSWTLKLSLIET